MPSPSLVPDGGQDKPQTRPPRQHPVRRRLILMLALGVAATIVGFGLFRSRAEPRCLGRPVSAWVHDLRWERDTARRGTILDTLARSGQEATPVWAALMLTGPTPSERLYRVLSPRPRLRNLVAAVVPPPRWTTGRLNMEGLQRIRDLGPEAVEAVLPALEGALRLNRDVGAVARIIGSLGRRGVSLAPALVVAYPKCSDDEKSMILTALVAIAPAEDQVARLCRGALSDPNPHTALWAAGYLLRYGYDAPDAMQRLLQALRDPSSPIGFLAAQLLGEAGTNALAAVPELERVARTGTIEMRWSATNALLRIQASEP